MGHEVSRLSAILLALFAVSANATEGDTFRPLLQYGYTHEDNLFRLSSSLPNALLSVFAPEGKGDSYQTLGAGFDLDWKQGRQRVLVNTLISQTRFDKYSTLDYEGEDLSGEWQWGLGNRLNGRLGTRYFTYLGSYQDTVGLAHLASNVRTYRNTYLNATYPFQSSWESELRLNRQSLDYTASIQASSNYNQDDFTVGTYYRGGELARTGVELSTLTGRYPDRLQGVGVSTAYDGAAVHFVTDWQVTGKSRLHGRLGYLSRSYNGSSSQPFSGLNGRVDWNWVPTGKTLFSLAMYRDLNFSEFAGADYQEVTGNSVRVQWQASPKVTLGASLNSDNNRYSGIPLDEDVQNAAMNVIYRPWPGGDITVSVQRQQRNSNSTLRDFDATVFALSALLRF